MAEYDTMKQPREHTPGGGVLEGYEGARKRLVIYEDPQCPYCAKFERAAAEVLHEQVVAGNLSVEYRMRSMLGPESVRANNALALAAESRQFQDLRRDLFAHQPEEHTGGFTTADLLAAGRRVGITDPDFEAGLHEGRYEPWAQYVERLFQDQDPTGTPALFLDGEKVADEAVYAPDTLADLLHG